MYGELATRPILKTFPFPAGLRIQFMIQSMPTMHYVYSSVDNEAWMSAVTRTIK